MAEGAEAVEAAGPASKGLVRSRLRLALQRLGGKRLLGVDVRSEADFVKVLDRGIPISALAELVRQEALSPVDVDRLIIPRRTLAHRKAKDQPLNRAESERTVRVASLTALAEETFANNEKAKAWLRRPTSALGGKRPIDLLDSEPGARVVEQLLYRIGHGIAA
ncbi:MAG: type II RES/Xre toxin-antitoxin system antitoxin [Geminicoccales bacterium]